MDVKIKNIQERLRSERKRKSLTLEDIWEISGVTPGQISRIERGESSLTLYSFIRLVHALKMSPSDFLSEFVDEFDFEIPKLLYERGKIEQRYPTFTIPDIEHFIHYSVQRHGTGSQLIKKRLREHVIEYVQETNRNTFDEKDISGFVNDIFHAMVVFGVKPGGVIKNIHYPLDMTNETLRQNFQAEGALLVQDVGTYIYNLRKEQGLTLQELGDEVGVVPATIMNLERQIQDRVLLRNILILDDIFDTKGELSAMAWRAGRLYLGIDRILVRKSSSFHPTHVGMFERLIILLRKYQHFGQLDVARDYITEVRKDSSRK